MCVFSVASRTTEGEKKGFSPFLNWFLFSPLIALLTTQCKMCFSAGVPLYMFFFYLSILVFTVLVTSNASALFLSVGSLTDLFIFFF